MDVKMTLDSGAELIINRFRKNGYEANVVGGAVRNHLLGIPITDIDIATSATPTEMLALFSDLRVIKTGIKHGTVTILAEGSSYEVTAYRTDGDYQDNRHPDSVSFTCSLREDLARRDFTVNAMAYNHFDGITDLWGGMSDLENRLIRAVGDPELRFSEDALRILRALRFASVLDFEIEENTANAVRKTAPLLDNVSRERVYSEWVKLVGGKGAYDVIRDYSDVIGTAIPELNELCLPDRERFDTQPHLVRTLALFFLSSVDPVSSFEAAMTTLHTDSKMRKTGAIALEIAKKGIKPTSQQVHRTVYRCGTDATECALRLSYTVGAFSEAEYLAALAEIGTSPILSLSDLAVDGRDIMLLGLKGVTIGDMLDRLALAVIDGECKNKKAELLEHANGIINAE